MHNITCHLENHVLSPKTSNRREKKYTHDHFEMLV